MIPLYTPTHRRDIPAVDFRVIDVSNNARCTCSERGYHTCPRHNPDTYADQQARHATDSIGPEHKNYVGWAR